MDFLNDIIRWLARTKCERSSKTVRYLQGLKGQHLHSTPDSGLSTVWDEYCVLTQCDINIAAFLWDHYHFPLIKDFIYGELERLNKEEKTAIWLQTRPGENWYWNIDSDSEEEVNREPPLDVDNIFWHIIYEYIEPLSRTWSNEPVRKYTGCHYRLFNSPF